MKKLPLSKELNQALDFVRVIRFIVFVISIVAIVAWFLSKSQVLLWTAGIGGLIWLSLLILAVVIKRMIKEARRAARAAKKAAISTAKHAAITAATNGVLH